MDVLVSAPVFPSEDAEKVMHAVKNIFPTATLERSEDGVNGTADLEYFSKRIRQQKILDAARSVMRKGRRSGRTVFRLNKQAAFAGKISFAEERTVLGTITVTVEDEDIDSVIDTVAPVTVDGMEVRT